MIRSETRWKVPESSAKDRSVPSFSGRNRESDAGERTGEAHARGQRRVVVRRVAQQGVDHAGAERRGAPLQFGRACAVPQGGGRREQDVGRRTVVPRMADRHEARHDSQNSSSRARPPPEGRAFLAPQVDGVDRGPAGTTGRSRARASRTGPGGRRSSAWRRCSSSISTATIGVAEVDPDEAGPVGVRAPAQAPAAPQLVEGRGVMVENHQAMLPAVLAAPVHARRTSSAPRSSALPGRGRSSAGSRSRPRGRGA